MRVLAAEFVRASHASLPFNAQDLNRQTSLFFIFFIALFWNIHGGVDDPMRCSRPNMTLFVPGGHSSKNEFEVCSQWAGRCSYIKKNGIQPHRL